ncbi:MAG: hypothetical protein JXR76_26280, partial [Deltaproteobacteria bacterium]|nr:hypothetical protein [Deltaproteobacteria bacterium]
SLLILMVSVSNHMGEVSKMGGGAFHFFDSEYPNDESVCWLGWGRVSKGAVRVLKLAFRVHFWMGECLKMGGGVFENFD